MHERLYNVLQRSLRNHRTTAADMVQHEVYKPEPQSTSSSTHDADAPHSSSSQTSASHQTTGPPHRSSGHPSNNKHDAPLRVTPTDKTENDLAEEIQVFRVEGPPTMQDSNMRVDDSDGDTADTVPKKNMPFVKITFRLRAQQETLDLTSALRLLQADIRHGSMPRTKANKQLAKLLKEIKTTRR